ncbi:type II toxin-antitoxin system RelB/DinJ family antitoxin [Alteromonas gracilis]|uniref:type II toxin-antitoxin system RelB/DinJ family antitoxin n=1 Tax=Alteromonas gracilis TaxID=1479524 RepID=UPI003736A4C4
MSENDFISNLESLAKQSVERKRALDGEEKFDAVGTQADATITFRVNKALKDEFTRVCKKNHSTPSREIKLFMNEVIRSQKLD